MNQQNNSITSKPTLRAVLSTFLFVLSLLSSNFSIAQEHSFIEEHNCHLCCLNESSSPEIIVHPLTFEFIAQVNVDIEDKASFILCLTRLFLSNSDPPLKFFNS